MTVVCVYACIGKRDRDTQRGLKGIWQGLLAVQSPGCVVSLRKRRVGFSSQLPALLSPASVWRPLILGSVLFWPRRKQLIVLSSFLRGRERGGGIELRGVCRLVGCPQKDCFA